jgi:hypothetical protein
MAHAPIRREPRGRRILAAAFGTIVAAAALACGPAPTATVPPSAVHASSPSPGASQATAASPAATPDRVAGWRGDLELLVPGMDAIHPKLTHGVSGAALHDSVASLVGSIEISTDDELMVGVLRIVAMVSAAGCDAHTGAFIWGAGTYPVDSLPFRLWLFEDDLVIVDALPGYEVLIGARIDAVEGRPIDDVLSALDPIIPRENAQTVRLLLPRYLLIPQVLRGLGMADEGPISLSLVTAGGAPIVSPIDSVSMAEYNAWAGPYGLHLPADPEVLYLSRMDEALWWQLLPDAETLYVQYNRVDHLPAATLADLRTAALAPDIARVVLDVRHNFGGELSALTPVVSLLADPPINQPGRLFVITGRNTFSAGSLLVARVDETEAVIVGEPMGGCPTTYGDASDLVLPFSGITVSVASELSVGVRADDERLTIEPDTIAVLTREDWSDGRDPALEAIVLVAP